MIPNNPKDSSAPKPPTATTKEPGQSPDGDAKNRHTPEAEVVQEVEPCFTPPMANGQDPTSPFQSLRSTIANIANSLYLNGDSPTPNKTTSTTEASSVNNSSSTKDLWPNLRRLLTWKTPYKQPPISGDGTTGRHLPPGPDATFTDEPLDLSRKSTQFPTPAEQRKIDNDDGSGLGASPLATRPDNMDRQSLTMAKENNFQPPSHTSSTAHHAPWFVAEDIMSIENVKARITYWFSKLTETPKIDPFQAGPSSRGSDFHQLPGRDTMRNIREYGYQYQIEESSDQKKVNDNPPLEPYDSSSGKDS